MQIYSDKIFENPSEIISIFDPKELKNGFDKLEELKSEGFHLVGYLRYDLSKPTNQPLMYFEGYKNFREFSPKKNISNSRIGIVTRPLITKASYLEAIDKIKQEIKNGTTYEVNYTYPSEVLTNVTDMELYEYLLQKQKTPYNAFLENEFETILSFSPELFFKLKGNKIVTKPMKGTAPRGKDKAEDEKYRNFLYNDTKNRAENIMIVDLLRNDLGRIAKTGSVKVDKLFEIEAHPTVFQMTSEISAELEEGRTLFDVFNAIYPCGSITGAPKRSTMRIISETEPLSREVYCGAIGYIHNDEAVFSVPIRILQRIKKHSSKSDEPAHFHYHAGGAIVWDSNSEEEWEETLTKTAFLKTDFVLIETAIDNWDAHFNRMKTSAKQLRFSWNEKIETLKIQEGKVMRVVLHKDGSFEVEYKNLPAKMVNPKIKVCRKTNSNNPFLYHKTSIRCSAPQDCFDEIALNEKGEITEGTFTNIGILKGGKYYTPPVSCGLLAGTKRAQLGWEEKILFLQDLQDADKIFCFNSVRGVVEVELC